MAGQKHTESIWSLPYVILIASNLFQSMEAFMINTILPVYINSLGVSTSMIGMIISSFSISAILIRPIATPAFDSFSRKRLLIISQVIICVSMVLYGIVDSIEAIIVIRLLHGIGIGCSGPLAMSLVSEFLPRSKFASGISIYTLAQSIAQVIGPAIGLMLMESVGFTPACFLGAGFLIFAIIGTFLIKEPYKERLKYELKLNRMFAPEAVSKAIAIMFLATSFMCMSAYVVLYGYARGVNEMGIFFVIYAACLIFTRPLFGNLADKVGTPYMLLVGILFFASSYVALWAANDLLGFIVAAILGSAGFGCCGPLLQSMALASVPASRRGAASTTVFTGLDIGTFAGPVIGGIVVDNLMAASGSAVFAYSNMWLLMLIPSIATLVITIRWITHRKTPSKTPKM